MAHFKGLWPIFVTDKPFTAFSFYGKNREASPEQSKCYIWNILHFTTLGCNPFVLSISISKEMYLHTKSHLHLFLYKSWMLFFCLKNALSSTD